MSETTAAEGEQQLDLERVLREIDDEVRARRASGDFPPGMERDLDLIFARFAPAGISGDDLDAVLQAADRASFVDVDVPTESGVPGLAYVKRTLRKLMSWYLRYLAQQVSAFTTAAVSAMRLLGRRVEALEASSPGANPRVLDEAAHARPELDVTPFEVLVAEHLAGADGRVLVAGCVDAGLLRRLVDAGLDAYGVDDRPSLAPSAAPRLEVRSDDVLDHLRHVAEEGLGGLVLCGCVDRLPLGSQLELADLAAATLADGARLAVVGTSPGAWERAVDPVAADLTPGRPLHPETWMHLLERRGFLSVERRDGPPLGALERIGSGGDGRDAVMDANLARIEEALFGPASFAVTAVRRR